MIGGNQNSSNGNGLNNMLSQVANNPLFQRAQTMLSGKSPDEIKTIVKNVASTRGISESQLSSILSQFGLDF